MARMVKLNVPVDLGVLGKNKQILFVVPLPGDDGPLKVVRVFPWAVARSHEDDQVKVVGTGTTSNSAVISLATKQASTDHSYHH